MAMSFAEVAEARRCTASPVRSQPRLARPCGHHCPTRVSARPLLALWEGEGVASQPARLYARVQCRPIRHTLSWNWGEPDPSAVLERMALLLWGGSPWRTLGAGYTVIFQPFHQVDCGGCLRARLCRCAAPLSTAPKRNVRVECIDSSYVKSIYGRDCIGRNPTDRGRNATKVLVMVASDGVPVALAIFPGNTSDQRTVDVTLRARLASRDIARALGVTGGPPGRGMPMYAARTTTAPPTEHSYGGTCTWTAALHGGGGCTVSSTAPVGRNVVERTFFVAERRVEPVPPGSSGGLLGGKPRQWPGRIQVQRVGQRQQALVRHQGSADAHPAQCPGTDTAPPETGSGVAADDEAAKRAVMAALPAAAWAQAPAPAHLAAPPTRREGSAIAEVAASKPIGGEVAARGGRVDARGGEVLARCGAARLLREAAGLLRGAARFLRARGRVGFPSCKFRARRCR